MLLSLVFLFVNALSCDGDAYDVSVGPELETGNYFVPNIVQDDATWHKIGI
jgi:hypothetical protein